MSRSWVAFAAIALAVSACGRRNGRTGKGPYADMVAEAVPKVEKAVGVPFKTPPRYAVLTREQVRDFLVKKFNQETPTAEIAGEEAAYKAFGLIPDTLQLRPFLINLLTEQIIGFYDPSTKELYIVKGSPEDLAGVTVTHELVHALQDQYVNLDSLQHLTGNNDREMAAQAVIEGQATYVQMSIMAGGHDIAALLPGGWDRVRKAIRDAQSAEPLFSAAPRVIQEELLFPYLSGAEFIRWFRAHYPKKLPFDDMPVSTTQILHESAFFSAKPDVPVTVVLPRTPGTTVYENNFGEFDTRLFIYAHTKEQPLAINAAEGWNGGRYRVLREPNGMAVVWVTAWRSPVDAAQFVSALDDVVEQWHNTPKPTVARSGRRTYRGSGRTVVVIPETLDSTPVVVFEDVPAGSTPTLIDPRAVRLK